MAENTVLPGTGDIIATEDTGLGYKLPVSKIRVGALDKDGGDVTGANPFPVGGVDPATGLVIAPSVVTVNGLAEQQVYNPRAMAALDELKLGMQAVLDALSAGVLNVQQPAGAPPINAGITDATGTIAVTVKAASTAAAATDKPLVVALHPTSLLPGNNRPDNYFRTAMDPSALFFDTFDAGAGLDVVDRWVVGGITPTTALGLLNVSAGTAALALSSIQSLPTFQLLGNMFNQALGIIKTDALPKVGNYRFFGFGSLPLTPITTAPITDGVGFEWNDLTGDLAGVVYAAGVKTQSLSLTASRPTDGAFHRYAIYYKTSRVYFEIDNVAVGNIANPAPNTSVLATVYLSVNGASTVSPAAVFQSTFAGVGDSARNNIELSDGLLPWRKATVKAPGVAPKATDGALVVSLSPNSSTAVDEAGLARPLPAVQAGRLLSVYEPETNGQLAIISDQLNTLILILGNAFGMGANSPSAFIQ